MLAGCTEKELARQVQYLKEENKILRSKLPRRITVTPSERRSLFKLGKPVGKAIKELITIVTPRTFARWVSADKGQTQSTANRRVGRPRTPDEIRDLILKLARETGWGYTKICPQYAPSQFSNNYLVRAWVSSSPRDTGIRKFGPSVGEFRGGA